MATLFSTTGTLLSVALLTFSAHGQQPSTRPKKVPTSTSEDKKKRPATSQAASTNSSGNRQSRHSHHWIKVAPVGEEFTVTMPYTAELEIQPDPRNRNEVLRTYSTRNDGGIYLVTSKSRTHQRGVSDEALLNSVTSEYKQSFFDSLGDHGAQAKIVEERDLTLEGFLGREYQFLMGDIPGVSRIYIAKRHLYTLTWINIVIADLPGEAHPHWFLDSFRLGELNTAQASTGVRTNAARMNSGIAVGLGYGIGDKSRERSSDKGETQKAVILSKPEPSYTEDARRNQVAGTVVLRVVLQASGQVSDIQVVRGLPYGLTERAMEAARRIKFKPATKGGRAVSQFTIIEYSFSPY